MAEKNSEVIITREFNAPRDMLFEVWSNPEHFTQWFSPKGFKNHFKTLDIRAGGGIHYRMTAPDGTEVWGRAQYREISKPNRIVYLQWFSNPEGGIGFHPLAPSFPRQMLTTIVFESVSASKSKITLTWQPYEATAEELATFEAAKPNMAQGWGGTFEQLDAYLAEQR